MLPLLLSLSPISHYGKRVRHLKDRGGAAQGGRADGTRWHRTPVITTEATRHPHTAAGILDALEQTSIAFDTLAAGWSAAYQEQRHPLLDGIQFARLAAAGSH